MPPRFRGRRRTVHPAGWSGEPDRMGGTVEGEDIPLGSRDHARSGEERVRVSRPQCRDTQGVRRDPQACEIGPSFESNRGV